MMTKTLVSLSFLSYISKFTPYKDCYGVFAYVPMKSREQTARRQHQGTPGQDRSFVINPVQVPSCHVCHSNGTSRAVQKLVAIPKNEILD